MPFSKLILSILCGLSFLPLCRFAADFQARAWTEPPALTAEPAVSQSQASQPGADRLAAPAPASLLAAAADSPLGPSEPAGVRPAGLDELISIDDPYAPELGNDGYDVQHYRLRLALNPAQPELQAQVEIQALAVEPLDQITLDFAGFELEAVQVDGQPAGSSRQGKKLIVALPQPVLPQQAFMVSIAYHGRAVQETSPYFPFLPSLGLQVQTDSLYIAAQPDGARYWFPCNDHPRDKATYRFELLVPHGLVGVANGVRVKSQGGSPTGFSGAGFSEAGFPGTDQGDWFIWEERQPMAATLATVAVGDFRRVDGRSPGGVPLRHYVAPGQEAEFAAANQPIGEMLDWMSGLFGPYPFDEFGYLTVTGLGGGLETQSLVLIEGDSQDQNLLAHEMAHMWFGDWVSLDSWGELWRSEGFATYVALLWDTRSDPQAYASQLEGLRQQVGSLPPQLKNPEPEELFGMTVYLKGALAAAALREEMGDEAFFNGLRAYFERYGGGSASDAEFQAVMEGSAGRSLDGFFTHWLAEPAALSAAP